MKCKATKRALVSSIVSIVLCVTMLIGTTFAWFTDTASTAVNKIQSGTLEVALEMKDGENWVDAEGKTLEFKKAADAPVGEEVLWEPGCTYELPELRIVNNGNLALKYKVQITGIDGDAKLNEAIEWTINGTEINLQETSLAADTVGESFIIKGHMKEEAGNEYQGLSIDGIGITVYATQDTVEYDSYSRDYDEHSIYPVEIIAKIEDAAMTKTTVKAADGSTDVEVFNYSNSDSTAKVTVPASGVTADTTPVVTIKPTKADATASTTIQAEGKDAIAYDISVTNLDGKTKATVEIYVGKGLNGVEVFHNEAKMADSDFSYDTNTGFITIKSATFSPFTIAYAKLFEGSGTQEDPFIITSVEDLINISAYWDSFNYYKVADGVTEIDCSGIDFDNYVSLNGEFDGNGVMLTHVDNCLFYLAGHYGWTEPTVFKNFTAELNNPNALVMYIDGIVVTFENVKVSGMLDGYWNMGAFVNYGTYTKSTGGHDFTLNFKNCSCDATIIAKDATSAGVLLGYTYAGGHTATINVDTNTSKQIESAKIYAKSGNDGNARGYKYYGWAWGDCIVNLDGTSVENESMPAISIDDAAIEKGNSAYTLAKKSDTAKVSTKVIAVLTALDKNNEMITGLNGITMTLGNSIEIKDVSGDSVDLMNVITGVEVVNAATESGGCEYKLDENGKLTVYTNSTYNYVTGTVSIVVSQYDSDDALIGTGTLVIAERTSADSDWTVK